jgi:hypothetical protein
MIDVIYKGVYEIRIKARWLRDIEKMKSEGTLDSSAISLIYVKIPRCRPRHLTPDTAKTDPSAWAV